MMLCILNCVMTKEIITEIRGFFLKTETVLDKQEIFKKHHKLYEHI